MIIDKLNSLIYDQFNFEVYQASAARVFWWLLVLFAFPLPYYLINFFENVPNYYYMPSKYNFVYYIFDAIPGSYFFICMYVILVICVFFIIFWKKAKFMWALLVIILLIQYWLKYSFWKIDHWIVDVLVPLILGLTWWWYFHSLDRNTDDNKLNNWWFFALLYVVFWAYFSAGLPKLFDPAYLSFNSHVVMDIMSNRWAETSNLHAILSGIDGNLWWKWLFFELFDYGALMFELVLPFLLFQGKRWINIFLIIAWIFHLANSYLTGIKFAWLQVVYLIILFLLYSDYIKWFLSKFMDHFESIIRIWMLPICIFTYLCIVFFIAPFKSITWFLWFELYWLLFIILSIVCLILSFLKPSN